MLTLVIIMQLAFLAATLIGFLLAILRNNAVYEERIRIINFVYQDSYSWQWKSEIFKSGPSYDEMFYKFWRPVNSFFPPFDEWEKPSSAVAA